MGYWDLTDAQRAFLKKHMGIDENSVVDIDKIELPILPEDDPLGAFLSESKGKEGDDRGAEVRNAARDGKFEIEKLVREQRRLLDLRRNRVLAVGVVFQGGLETRQERFDDAAHIASAAFDRIVDQGHKMSIEFRVNGATADLDDLAKEKLKEVAEARKVARADILKAVDEIGTLANQADALNAENVAAFSKALALAQTRVTDLLRWEHPSGSELDTRLKAINETASADFRAATQRVQEIEDLAKVAAETATRDYDDFATVILQQIDEAKKQALALEKSFAERRWSLSKGEKALTVDKLDAASSLAKSGKNQSGLKAASQLAEQAMEAILEIKGSRIATPPYVVGGEPTPAVTDQIDAAKKSIKACLGTDKYAKRRPNDKEKMQKLFDALLVEGETLTPPKFLAKITDMKDKIVGPGGRNWTSYAGRVETQLGWDTSMELVSDSIKNRIKALDDLLTGGETYKGALTAELERALDMLKLEEPETIKTDVDALIRTLQAKLSRFEAMGGLDAVTDDPVKLAARAEFLNDQSEGLSAEAKLKEEKAAYETAFKTAMNLIDGFAKDDILKDKRKKTEFDEIKAQAKSTGDLVKDGKDYQTAMGVLKRAETRLQRLKDSGPAVSAKALGQIGAQWRSAMQTFRDGIDNLGQAITDAVAGDDARAGQVRDVLAHLLAQKRYFRDDIFDAPITVLATSKTTKDRKRAREDVLRDVGLYRDYIVSNTTMKAIVSNKFGVQGIGSVMFAKLNDIEFEVIRSQ